MKTFRNLYPQVCDFENLYLAYRAARKGKRGKATVAAFEFNQELELALLQEELSAKTYQPGPYNSFYVHDPKKRLISAAPFRDRIVHHALCRVIEPIFEARFIHDSYACRIGKGTHKALDRCQHFARRYQYVLQCDVKQFFPSIDHALLRARLAHWIRDDDLLWLIDRILDSGIGVLAEEYEMAWFAGDDLTAAWRPRGLPIGNLTSQFWANVYLDILDQFVKRALKVPAYLRYCDDFLLFGDDKAQLREWRAAVIEQASALRLTLHEGRAQVFPVATGIPFLGFRVHPTHRRIKRRKAVAFGRRWRAALQAYANGRISREQLEASLHGWIAHARHGDTYGLRKALIWSTAIPKRQLTLSTNQV
ncbi:MAG TPA: reverse transcriptase/maturase family protein [Caldilineaceae bacterium]|nr:reverse transcriptase/maturase family protein [Caldilineaceae bacterium]